MLFDDDDDDDDDDEALFQVASLLICKVLVLYDSSQRPPFSSNVCFTE